MAIFALRYMNNLSAGQAQKGVEWPDLYILSLVRLRTIYRRLAKPKWPDLYILSLACHFCIAPYEQFINFCPSPERSQMARSLHFKIGLPFCIAPYEQFISGATWPDLYILSLDCHFCIAPYEQFISGWNLSAAG